MNKYYKVLAATVASVSTVYLVSRTKEDKLNASWTTNYEPSLKWNSNWDHRDPSSLTKPKSRHFSSLNQTQTNENNETVKKTVDDSEINKHSTKATRHLFLVRHGQYEVNAKEADKMVLTQLGLKKLESNFNFYIKINNNNNNNNR
jgi:isochorismate synthase EntC